MPLPYLIILFISLFLKNPALAEESQTVETEPLVFTASKVEESLSEIPASVEVKTRQDIEVRQALSLDEALRGVSGLIIRTYGGADPWTSISLRGTGSRQSMVMIDGIRINPVYSQAPGAGALLLNSAGRIEVVKGAYSALYGSEAMGGVINVITRDDHGLTYSLQGGPFTTFDNSLIYSDRYKDISYTLGYERFSTEGFRFSGPYWNNTLLGKIKMPIGSEAFLQLYTYYWDWKKYDYTICCEINRAGDLAFKIDKNSQTREDNWLNGLQLSQYPSEWWDYSIKLNTYITNQHADNPLDPATTNRPFPLESDSDIQSERDTFDMQHNFYPDKSDIVTLGFQYTREWLNKKEFGNLDSLGTGPSLAQPAVNADRFTHALYLQNLFKIKDKFSFTAGARFENMPGIVTALIPKVSALYAIPVTDTILFTSYGQGIRAPDLEELYDPFKGNTGLKPEKSSNIEAGFRQTLLNYRMRFDAAVFRIRLKDRIDIGTGPTGAPVYLNMDKSKITGTEAGLRWTITEKLEGNIGLTVFSTKNLKTREQLPFRPDKIWTLEAIYKPLTQLVLDINVEYTGESFNPFDFLVGVDGTALSDKVPAHEVVNIAAAYNIIKGDPILGSLDFTLKLNNILDKEYADLPDFRSYGFNFLAGVRSVH